jgi:hypothetical protein
MKIICPKNNFDLINYRFKDSAASPWSRYINASLSYGLLAVLMRLGTQGEIVFHTEAAMSTSTKKEIESRVSGNMQIHAQ